MHELFTTTLVPEYMLQEVLRILQGLCGMRPKRKFQRRLIFEGPKSPPLVGIGAALLQTRKPANNPLWRELHEQLVRQSYYLTLAFEVDEAQFGTSSIGNDGTSTEDAPDMDLEEMRGSLHFLDNPDPPGTRSVHSRLAVHIKDESHLPSFLEKINYTCCAGHIREAYYAYRDNVILCLSRDLHLSKQAAASSSGVTALRMASSLPAFEEFQPFDVVNKWLLTASIEVSDGNQPVLVQRALDQLAQVKHDFSGIFEFTMTPRRQLDTRVLSYNQSMRT